MSKDETNSEYDLKEQKQNEDLSENSIDVNEDHSSESDAADLEEVNRYWPPPINESVELAASYSSKTVSAFTFNNAGSRFAAGGHDHEVRIWDFEGIDLTRRPESICNSQPCGQTVIKNLDFSNDDELVLVISGSCEAVIMAKDGIVANQYKCPKGDQYITDMLNTKGHVQMLNDGCWNPKNSSNFITCSNDGTVRIWDLGNGKSAVQQKNVIKTRSPMSGLKALPNVCRYSRDALSIVASCNDGSVLMWDTRRKFISTSSCIKNAHLKGSEITGLDFSYGLNKICTRSEDESCKIWDTRQLKVPLAARTGLTTLYSATDCSFSPDDKLIITGTSGTKQESGKLHFLDVNDQLITVSSLEVPETSIIRCKWHPKINHIGYSCSNGSLFVVYDKKRSIGGFLATELSSSCSKGIKRKKYISHQNDQSAVSMKKIITPHSLPLFREDTTVSSFAKIRQDPRRSYKPEMPVTGASQGGRVKPAGSTLSSFIARNIAKPVDDNGMDIRERILRHAEKAENEPFWIKPVHPPQTGGSNDNLQKSGGSTTTTTTNTTATIASVQQPVVVMGQDQQTTSQQKQP